MITKCPKCGEQFVPDEMLERVPPSNRPSKEQFMAYQAKVEASKRRDCAEYPGCDLGDPALDGCAPDCPAYNRSSDETTDDLTGCVCEAGQDKLDIAHVTWAHWVVLCHGCGRLSQPGKDRAAGVKNWNENKMQREKWPSSLMMELPKQGVKND